MVYKNKVSVILTSYNHAKYLREAIDSVLGQTYADFELIIWDDASEDESWNIISSYRDPRIKAFRNEARLGGKFGVNKAIAEIAAGEYIAIQHSDDVWEPQKLEKQVAFLDKNPDMGAVFTHALIIGENGEPFKDKTHFYYSVFDQPNRSRFEWLNHFFYHENALCHPSILIRKVCYDDCGLYRYGLVTVPDFDMWVRLCLKYDIHILPEKLVRYRVRAHEANASGDRPEVRIRVQFEILQIYDSYTLISNPEDFLKVFPHAAGYFKRDGFDMGFALGMMALEAETLITTKLFGLSLLFRIMNDPERAKKINELYRFTHNDFIALTAKHDFFSIGAIADLSNQVAAKERSLQELNDQLVQKQREYLEAINGLKGQLDEIYRSFGWRTLVWARRMKNKLAPPGGKRARLIQLTMAGMLVWREQGLRAFIGRLFLKVSMRFGRKPAMAGSSQALQNPGLYQSVYLDSLETSSKSKREEYIPLTGEEFNFSNEEVKLIAFYLPQFHPFPENDEWWGKGFTEWTNVSKAVPNFVGHYQPRLPGELGFYDLRLPEVQRRQVELAKKYGIHGFCFHYYWFSGKRLLERPLNLFLEDTENKFPFCLCWANENWTRRWDGAENEVLIGQSHSADEYLAFIRDVIPNFLDTRYIRVNGKPLLIVYRVNLLPDPHQAAAIWRAECRKQGIGDIYLVAAQSFGITDPRVFGFDAAVEFPPHNMWSTQISRQSVEITNPYFTGRIFDYAKAVRLMKNMKAPDYTLFRTIMPAWDNTARKQNDGYAYINSTPSAYKTWLANTISYTQRVLPEGEQLIFINAWNEWGEGAYLEPDRRYGYAYLQATAETISSGIRIAPRFGSDWTILFVSHDAHKYGAQVTLLNTIAWLKEHTALNLKILCLADGPLLPSFQDLVDTIMLDELQEGAGDETTVLSRLVDFCGGKPDLIYGNTVVSGKAYAWLNKLGSPILTNVCEMEMSIQRYAANTMAAVLSYSKHYFSPSGAVRDNLIKNHSVDPEKISVVYGAVKNEPVDQDQSAKEKERKKKKLGLDSNKALIMACGSGMPFRKGADLLIQVAKRMRQQGRADFHFYWIGGFDDNESDPKYGKWATHKKVLSEKGLDGSFTFLGYKPNLIEFLQLADVFVLPSREDPFPLVALEAAKCSLPVVCFADAGGTAELVGEDAGFIVPYENVEAMAEKVIALIADPGLRTAMGNRAREKFLSDFTIERTAPKILSTCREVAGEKPTVSIIVPNYNHEKYLEPRLESIFNQTFQDFEVILLDDCSTDKSMEVLEKYAARWNIQVIRNQANSGSPFKQWLKGIQLAQSDILWIAESDDVCEPAFLETLLPAFKDPRVKLAYAASRIIDDEGLVIGDYASDKYLLSLSSTKWQAGYQVPAGQEIIEGLGIKNTVLNMSSALLRKFVITPEIQKKLDSLSIAGDWYFIIQAIKNGDICYYPDKMNMHRRHASSVIAQTVSDKRLEKFFGEFGLVQADIFNNYHLTPEFKARWEEYLRQVWSELAPGEDIEHLKQYYPVEEMTELVMRASNPNMDKEYQ